MTGPPSIGTSGANNAQPIPTKQPQKSQANIEEAANILEELGNQQEQELPPPVGSHRQVKQKQNEAKTTQKAKTLESAAKELKSNLDTFTKLLEEDSVENKMWNQVSGNLIAFYGEGVSLYTTGTEGLKSYEEYQEGTTNQEGTTKSLYVEIKENIQSVLDFLEGEKPAEYKPSEDSENEQIISLLSDANDILNVLQNSSLLIQKREQIKERKELLKTKLRDLKQAIVDKKPVDEIKQKEIEIKALRESIQQISYELTEGTKQTVLKTGLLLPKIADHVYSAVKLFSGLQNNIPVSAGIGIAGEVTNIIAAGFNVYEAHNKASSHERHTEDLKPLELKEELTPTSTPLTKRDNELTDTEMTEKIETEKRLAKERKLNSSKIFTMNLNRLKEGHKNNFDAFKKSLVVEGIQLNDEINSYEVFNAKFDQDIKFREMLEQKFNSISTLDKIDEKDLTTNQKTIKTILNKRNKIKKERIKEESEWLEKLINDYKEDFQAFKQRIEKEGIKLGDEIQSFDQLTPEIKKSVIEKHIDYKDTLTTTAKNQLKTRLKAQEEITSNFFKFKLTKSKVLFGTTTIASVTTIGLSAALIAGLAFPPAFFIIPSIIGVAATFGALAMGIYYLHKQKPNLTKTYLQMIPLQMVWNQIPLLFAELNLKINEWKKDSLADEIEEIANRILILEPEDQMAGKTLFDFPQEELLERQESDLQRANDINESVDYWTTIRDNYQKHIEDLKEVVVQARKDDFELKTGFKSFSGENLNEMSKNLTIMKEQEKELLAKTSSSLSQNEINILKSLPNKIKYLEDKINGLQNKTADEFTIIAEALIKGEFWKDPEASAFISKYGGIALEKELKLESATLDTNKTFLSQRLRDIILKNSQEILEWLEKQNIREVEV